VFQQTDFKTCEAMQNQWVQADGGLQIDILCLWMI
jgi:hypothetical protein